MRKSISFLLVIMLFLSPALPARAAGDGDPLYEQQTNLHMINIEYAWDKGLDGTGVRIAVIDSGVYSEHDDLRGAKLLSGFNMLDSSSDVKDSSGHGTFITAMLSAPRNDGVGLAGMVDGAEVVPIKCFSSGQQTGAEYILSAIYLASGKLDCDVINLSIGIPDDMPALKKAIDHAVSQGVIIVASVGNNGGTSLMYPAAYENVVGVGSVDSSLEVSDFSQHNDSVFVVAPGSDILSAGISSPGVYMRGSGTSFSSVHVTALAAMAKQLYPNITASEFMALLKMSTTDLGTPGYDTTFGWGLINVPHFVDNLLSFNVEFSDTEGHWAESAIARCAAYGILTGTGGDRFEPESPLTRAMAAAILHRMAGSPEPSGTAGFTDVPAGSWYSEAVAWASEQGIVLGTGGGLFSPDEYISREELAVLFCRFANSLGITTEYTKKPAFSDSASIDTWAKQSVYWCAFSGLITGRPDGSFDPHGSATRAEAAVITVRFASKCALSDLCEK